MEVSSQHPCFSLSNSHVARFCLLKVARVIVGKVESHRREPLIAGNLSPETPRNSGNSPPGFLRFVRIEVVSRISSLEGYSSFLDWPSISTFRDR